MLGAGFVRGYWSLRHAPLLIALFCKRHTAWLLAALGRREAPSPASGPMNSPHDEFWAAGRSRRRFATLNNDRTRRRTNFSFESADIVKNGTPDQCAILRAHCNGFP